MKLTFCFLLVGSLLLGCKEPISDAVEVPNESALGPIVESVTPEQTIEKPPAPAPLEEKKPKPKPAEAKPSRTEPEPERTDSAEDRSETDPWQIANQQRSELRDRINKERQEILAQMRAKLRQKQKSLQTARNIHNKANKLKKDKDPSFKQLEKEAKEHDNLAKQAENEHKQIQQQLKKIAREQSDENKRISDWARKEAEKLRKLEEAKRKQEQFQAEKPLETGPMQIGEVRKAQVRSINPRHKDLNLFSGSTKEGFSTQVYELGQDAAIIVNGVPGHLESIRSGNNLNFWVHPEDSSTITWLEANTE